MSIQNELASLYARDLTRLRHQIDAFPNDRVLWEVVPGITNSAGTLALHLEGNLREYIGRQLGGVPYERDRPREFSERLRTKDEIGSRIDHLTRLVPSVIRSIPTAQLAREHRELVLDVPSSTHQLLVHLYAHLSWHTGQVDYLRRVLTEGRSIPAVGLGQISPSSP
jgi:uncharacterized protein DUF1572